MNKYGVPHLILDKIWLIDEELLRALDVRALIVDVDNTLTTHGAPEPADEVVPWLRRMEEAGLPIVILSNNTHRRVEPFAKLLGLPCVSFAVKPMRWGFLRAARQLGQPPKHIAVVGDQIFTDIVGGNKAGMKTILVLPIDDDTDRYVQFKRRFEKPYLDAYYKSKKNR